MKKQKYYQEQTDNGFVKPTVERIYELLKVKNKFAILDIGCGAGYIGEFKPKQFKDIVLYGLDIDDIAKENLKRGYSKIVIKDIEKEDYKLKEFPTGKFDLIIAKDFLEHILKPWKLMPELYRILKKGGQIYAEVPHYTSGLAWIDYTHVRPFTRNSLRMLFIDYGFKISRLSYFGFWIFTPKFFAETLVNWPFFSHFAGNLEVIAIK